MIKRTTILHDSADGIMACIARIMCVKDRAGVERAIEALEQINTRIADETGTEPVDVRRMLREGIGVFGDVAEKVKRMGVV